MSRFGMKMDDGTMTELTWNIDWTIGRSNKHLTNVEWCKAWYLILSKRFFKTFPQLFCKKEKRCNDFMCTCMSFIFILTIPNWERKVRNTNLGNGLKALSPYFHASLTQRLLRITKKQSEDFPSPSINLRNFVLAQRKRQEDAKNSTMPTPNFIPHTQKTHRHFPTSGWITTKITSIWNWWFFSGGFCSTTFLVIGCLHEIQAVTSNSWPSQDPATLVVLVNVIPSDAFQVDNGTLISKRNDEIATNLQSWNEFWWVNESPPFVVVWLGCLEFYWIYFWIKLEGVCRLAGWTLLVESETTKPNHQIICWESKHHASYVAE